MSIEVNIDTLPAYLRGEGAAELADQVEAAGRDAYSIVRALHAGMDRLDGEAREVCEQYARMLYAGAEMGDIEQLRAEMEDAINRRDTEMFGVGGPPGDAPQHPRSPRVGLIESGARRRLADALKADASADLAAWCRAAVEAGLTKVEISELSGASRTAIDRWLEQ